MKAFHLLIIFALVVVAPIICPAQQETNAPTTGANLDAMGVRGYLLGPGDILSIKVLGETQMDGDYDVNDEGNIEFPFVDAPIPARCRTDKEVRADLTAALKKYLRNPQVSVRVKEKNSRPPAVVFGAVRAPQRIVMYRRVRLLEIISVAGGVEEGKAGGTVQIFHTTPLMCPDPNEDPMPQKIAPSSDDEIAPYLVYNLADLKQGKKEANPFVNPGDIIIVPSAPPVYITGSVVAPQNIYWSENLTLTKAMAMVGGIRKEAKSDKVIIRRLKQGSKDYEITTINFDAIRKQKEKDFALQPYDIIEVDEAGMWSAKRLPSTLAGLISGGLGQGVTNLAALPTRIIY
jgi:polysaccharide export outer membrane protein